ncbi:MAG: alcohol dehydrogenase [Bacteroidetes bacterium GWF2_38_335]|nr:MAG: alcohol dehydrogenase [Bacteroidetes bacterium GWF2_38_335]OFY77914.1 MAG: alcohol dehydrogenase [Bacteroidetes bacterium RIFOXYA12_FULL_38_20]HBS86653.1 alcohol dehydrogenase [Bacteroidales bacterium]
MIYDFRNFKSVDNFAFGKGCFNHLEEILDKKRKSSDDYMVYLIDKVFENNPLAKRISLKSSDYIIWIDTTDEPKTKEVDRIRDEIIAKNRKLPAGIIGIGGGSVIDYSKAISMMVTNEGSSAQYQGLDLIKNPGIYNVCIPTLAGTGAEVSMTAVLTGPEKKLGIKCDYTVPNQILLDPELTQGAPLDQRFYTGMDCYIHAVESVSGTWKNHFSDAFAEKSLEMCRKVFLEMEPGLEADELLMVASYMGGLSLTYSQVGVCHALGYGLSYVLGTHHGIAGCIAFNQLEDYYGEHVADFRKMMEKNQIHLPTDICKNLPEEKLDKMAQTAINLEHMWDHALGKQWKQKITKEQIKDLFRRM